MVRIVAIATLMLALAFAARINELEGLEAGGRRRPGSKKRRVKRKKNRAKHMQLDSIQIDNKCTMPVYFFEAQSGELGPFAIEEGKSAIFKGDVPGLQLGPRMTFSYGSKKRDGEVAVIELGRGFEKFQKPVKHFNFNFINKYSFLDLNLHMSLWKDKIGGALSCEDGRVQTAFKMSECEQPDGSANIVERQNPDGQTYQICEAKYKPDRDENNRAIYKPEACTSDYARYINSKSLLYQPSSDSWVPSADSVGVDHHGFTHASMSDGSTKPSTLTGRDGDGSAINQECFEFPCGKDKDGSCKATGQVPSGNIGFAKCSFNGPVAKFGVMQVVLCPDAVDA